MEGKRTAGGWRIVLLAGLMGLAVGAVRLGQLGGLAAGGTPAGCGGPTVETAPAEQAGATALDLKAATVRYGGLATVARLPEGARATAAGVLARVKERAELAELDPAEVRLVGYRTERGVRQAHLRQVIGDVTVYDSDAFVDLDARGAPLPFRGLFRTNLHVDTKPKVPEEDAARLAIAEVHCAECEPRAAITKLFVMRVGEKDLLVHRVWPRNANGGPEPWPMVFVDAHSGEVVRTCTRAQDPVCFDEPR